MMRQGLQRYTRQGIQAESPTATGQDVINALTPALCQKAGDGEWLQVTGRTGKPWRQRLMYYKARYYDPALGRFITADSVIPGADKTQAYNRYMYVAGNPVGYNDPDGHGFHKWVKKVCKDLSSDKAKAMYLIVGATAITLANPVTGVGLILGGTHMKPWKMDRWEHFDYKDAGKGIIVSHVVSAMAVSAVANPGLAGYAATSGGINAYMNCRDGGSLQDVFVSFTIGYTVAYCMPISSGTPLMDAILTGAARGAITNGLTQSYNMTLGQKTHQDKFSVGSLGLSIATGAASGAFDSWGRLTNIAPIDGETYISFYGATSVASVMDIKTFSILAIGMEESIYLTQRQND